MKKIIYSNITKALAVLLLIAALVSGIVLVGSGIEVYDQEDPLVYRFENDFSESHYIQTLLSAPQHAVHAVFRHIMLDEDETRLPGETSLPEDSGTEGGAVPDTATLIDELDAQLRKLYCAEHILYIVEWNGLVISNTGGADREALRSATFYSCIERKENGSVSYEGTMPEGYSSLFYDEARWEHIGELRITVAVKEAYATLCRAAWERQEALVTGIFSALLTLSILSLFLLIYLLCVCGKNAAGEQRIAPIDRIPTEIHLLFAGVVGGGGTLLILWLFEEHMGGNFPFNLLFPTVGCVAALSLGGVLTSLLSIVRNIKCRRTVDASLILSLIRLMLRGLLFVARRIGRGCRSVAHSLRRLLSRRGGVLLLILLGVYTGIVGFATFAFYIHKSLWLACVLITVLLFLVACRIIARHTADLDAIRKGASAIRSGDVTYRIPTPQSEELRQLAEDVSGIALGLDEAVSARLKAERMKAELITNVSHDLKTPLTSIINYTELLSQVEGLPEEARDYVAVIAKKNARLKNLTQDLFDISKAQSGDEEVTPERLDVATLIEQAMAEHESDPPTSALSFLVNTEKELFILADGRKMSRVVGNLIGNILKYAMKDTRVFITAVRREGQILMEFKNISAYPIEFDAEEIVGRFVRGDSSRSTEGSGLGLAIAKSYTELCGGRMEVTVDGDLFKVILTFPAADAEG